MALQTKEHKIDSSKETKNTLQEFPLLERIRNATREKARNILKETMARVGTWVRSKIDKLLPGLLTPIEDAIELPEAKLEESPEDIRQRESMGKEFSTLLNQYRGRSGLKHLETDQELMKLAGNVAGFQAYQGKLNHTSALYRRQNQFQDEILVSGFKTPQAALKKFVESETHYKSLMGSYKKMGYAIRPGVEEKTGETMYYLAVLFRDGKPLDSKKDASKQPVPEVSLKEPTSLAEALQNTPGLKPYFSSLDEMIKAKDPQLSYTFDTERTKQLGVSQKNDGLFGVKFSKGGKTVSYLISNSPARLNRLDKDKKEAVQFRFEEVIDDVQKLLTPPPAPKEEERVEESEEIEEIEEVTEPKKG